ncbi:MAG: tyrosine-type recombinase/integrase [Defluviicoccus sp.]|nr:tyrosine-type recombinase/integrase [Defluviicoccus sp.]
MARKRRVRLTDAGIARLRPREKEYTVWDSRVDGLGVRVRPSGGKSYVLFRKTENVLRRISFGPTMLKSIVEVRREFEKPGAKEKPVRQIRPRRSVPVLREFVAGPWTEAHFNRYKPSTQRGVRFQLERRILPAFGSKRLDRISPAAVRRWFDRHSRTAPGNANQGLRLLRQIMNFAVACGHVKANPTNGIRLNRGNKLSRFLSREEIARLHAVLDEHALKGTRRQQVDIIRLLLLTGCRKGEIVNLRWSEVDGDMLVLGDGKTGPRRVPLNAPARRVLERQPKEGSVFVFPSPHDPAGPRTGDLALWYRIRREAGIEDCRLHDLRHTLASQAVMNGVPVPVVSRLLGHSSVSMTLRYAHLGDREVEAAAERVGQYIGSKLGL